jgi:hypothetical protein
MQAGWFPYRRLEKEIEALLYEGESTTASTIKGRLVVVA